MVGGTGVGVEVPVGSGVGLTVFEGARVGGATGDDLSPHALSKKVKRRKQTKRIVFLVIPLLDTILIH